MDKFEKAFEEAHDIEFDAFKFDEPDYEALIVTEETLLEHLKVQAAGIAYYGTLAKNAERYLNELEKKYKYRYNEMYSECADILSRAGKKSGTREIESFVQCKYGKELEEWDKQINEAKINKEGIASYYEGWKNKGFALNSITSLVTAGLLTPRTTISEEDVNNNTRRRRMNSETAGSILANHKTKKID